MLSYGICINMFVIDWQEFPMIVVNVIQQKYNKKIEFDICVLYNDTEAERITYKERRALAWIRTMRSQYLLQIPI